MQVVVTRLTSAVILLRTLLYDTWSVSKRAISQTIRGTEEGYRRSDTIEGQHVRGTDREDTS